MPPTLTRSGAISLLASMKNLGEFAGPPEPLFDLSCVERGIYAADHACTQKRRL